MLKLEKIFKQNERATTATETAVAVYSKPVFDENGNEIGTEYFRPVFDENKQVIGEEKVDMEAERKAREEKEKRLQEELQKQLEEQRLKEEEEEEGAFYFQAGEVIGEDDEEAEAEEEAVHALAEKRKVFKEQAMAIRQNPNLTEEQKRKGLNALLAANTTETTETVPLATTETPDGKPVEILTATITRKD
jgi:predicted DNA-binding WGR domain protein